MDRTPGPETNPSHAFFYLTKNILPMMPWGGSIINNASINPFVGHPKVSEL